jgi:hypothetical protein
MMVFDFCQKKILNRLKRASLAIAVWLPLSTTSAFGQNVDSCAATATTCRAGCSVAGALGRLLGNSAQQAAEECRSRCTSAEQVCLAGVNPQGQSGGRPASTTPNDPPSPGSRSPNAPLSANARPQELQFGNLRIGILDVVSGNPALRDLTIHSVNGQPAVIIVDFPSKLRDFRKQFAEYSSAGRPIQYMDDWDIVRYLQLSLIVGDEKRLLDELRRPTASIVTSSLRADFQRQFLTCAIQPSRADQGTGISWACPVGAQPGFIGATEFEQARTRQNFSTEVANALRGAFTSQTPIPIHVIEGGELGSYDSANGGFPVSTKRNGSTSAVTSWARALNRPGDLPVVFSNIGFSQRPAAPLFVSIPPSMAEQSLLALIEKNRAARRSDRTVVTVTKYLCDVRASTRARGPECEAVSTEIYSEIETGERFGPR